MRSRRPWWSWPLREGQKVVHSDTGVGGVITYIFTDGWMLVAEYGYPGIVVLNGEPCACGNHIVRRSRTVRIDDYEPVAP